VSPEQQKALDILADIVRTNSLAAAALARIVAAPAQLTDQDETVLSCIPPEPERVTGEALLEKVNLTLGVELSERTLNTVLQRLKALGLVTSSNRKPFGYSRP
jgi:hypothetical protein